MRFLVILLLVLGTFGCTSRRGGGDSDDDDSAADDDDSVIDGIGWSPAVDADDFGLLDVGTIEVGGQTSGEIIGTNGTSEVWTVEVSTDLSAAEGWLFTLPTSATEVLAGETLEVSFTLAGVPGDVAERGGLVHFSWGDELVSYEVTGRVE